MEVFIFSRARRFRAECRDACDVVRNRVTRAGAAWTGTKAAIEGSSKTLRLILFFFFDRPSRLPLAFLSGRLRAMFCVVIFHAQPSLLLLY